MALFIFDMGNVVCRSIEILSRLAKVSGVPARNLSAVRDHNDFWGLASGEITTEEFWNKFRDTYGVSVPEDYLKTLFHPEINEQVADILIRLREMGHRIVCGTNTIESHYQVHMERGDYRFFDAVYASHLIGLVKPHAEFYEYILNAENYSCTGEEKVFFIDDLPGNVEAARRLGIVSHCFSSAEGLRNFLIGNGLPLSV